MKKFFSLSILIFIIISGCKTMDKYNELKNAMELSDYLDKKVAVTGKISDMPWQHLIGYFKDYPNEYYFDIEDYQIVIYTKEKINYNKLMKVYGKAIIVGSKHEKSYNYFISQYIYFT